MKKISMILFAVAMAFTFAACGGSKGGETTPEEATTTTPEETTAPAQEAAPAGDAAASADEFINNYEKLVNDLIPVIEKAAKGDAAATADYAKLSENATTFAADAQKFVPNFTAEQMKRYEEITKKYTDAIMKMTPKK